MTHSSKAERFESDLARWLVAALEGHMPSGQIQSKLVSQFGLKEDEARIVEGQAVDGILRAISGSQKNRPDATTNPVGHAAFELVWNDFHQNSFFDKRHAPNRKWLDWKAQQKYL